MPRPTRIHRAAMLGGIAITCLASAAHAQDVQLNGGAPAQEDDPLDQTIVVTGTRLQNEKSIDARRSSDVILDAVTSDDIGRLPDFNVGEALQRLPGIGVQNDQAEVRFVTIRGLNAEYNYTTIDGVSVAVPDRNGRRVFMDVLPASLAQRVDVIKTLTPNLEGGAIGGVIDIKTADAFDFALNTVNLSAEIGKYTNDEGYRDVGPSGTADAFYSTRFGANESFGIVLTGNYYRRDSVIPQTEWGSSRYFFNDDGSSAPTPDDPPYTGNGYPVPTERRAYWYHNTRQRYGGTAKLQFRAGNGQDFFLRGFYNTATDDEARQTDLLSGNGRGPIINQTATSGTLLSASRQSHYLGQFDFERTVWQVAAGADLLFDDDAQLTIRLNYSGSRFRNPENWIEWRMSGDNDGNGIDDNAYSYRCGDDECLISLVDPEANRDFRQYGAYRRQFDDRQLDEDLYEAKIDWSDRFGSGPWSYGLGASFRRVERVFDEERDFYGASANNEFTLAAADVLNTDVCLRPPGYGDRCMVVIDPVRATRNWAAHFGANPGQWVFDDLTSDDNRLDYGLNEDVWAAYGLIRRSDDRSNLILGLRYERTDDTGTGRRNVSGVGFVDVENKGGYDSFLPSANFSYELTDNILLRAAASRAIGRPAYNLIAPAGESLNRDTLVLSRSNPNLQPRESTNLDLGADWYFDGSLGILGINLFYKQVENEIFSATFDNTIQLDGQTVPVTVTQPVNNGIDTNIYGLELQLVKDLNRLLPGLGISGNLTLLDTDFTVLMDDGTFHQLRTMIGQPNISANAAIFYDDDRLSARLAYNYQSIRASERIRTDQEYRNRYDTKEHSLDFKAAYRITEGFALTFNAWNITGAGRGEVLGFDQEIPIVKADFGSAYFLGFNLNF